jgi:hypothetical protein
LLEDSSLSKAALLINAVSYQALAGDQIHCAAEKTNRASGRQEFPLTPSQRCAMSKMFLSAPV